MSESNHFPGTYKSISLFRFCLPSSSRLNNDTCPQRGIAHVSMKLVSPSRGFTFIYSRCVLLLRLSVKFFSSSQSCWDSFAVPALLDLRGQKKRKKEKYVLFFLLCVKSEDLNKGAIIFAMQQWWAAIGPRNEAGAANSIFSSQGPWYPSRINWLPPS